MSIRKFSDCRIRLTPHQQAVFTKLGLAEALGVDGYGD